MLSLPDFKQKQIIYIESNDLKKISFQNDNLVLKEEDKVINRVSCYKMFCIFIIGEISITSVFIRKAASYGIAIFMMSKNFNVYAAIGGQSDGNYLLRKKQYDLSNSLNIAKHLVHNKISNQLELIKKKRGKNSDDKNTIEQLKKLTIQIEDVSDEKSLLGMEGSASKLFFQNYFKPLKWARRMPRTKFDTTNTLLDIGYTYLFNFIDAHLRLYGFDSYIGVYHKLYFQRRSLACDIMEPFRCIIDKQLLKAHNLKQIDSKDFYTKGDQYILQYKKAGKYTKIFLEAIMDNKEEIFLHVQKYYRCIINEKDDYPTFLIK